MAVTPAIGAIDIVTDEVLLVVILVVILRRPELRGGDDVGHNRYSKLLEVFWRNHDPRAVNAEFCDVGSQYRPAIFVHDEMQRRLAEESKRAVAQQLQKGDPAGVVHDLDRLGMIGPAGRDLLVGRIGRATASIAGGGRDDISELVERRLHAPEAAPHRAHPRPPGGKGARSARPGPLCRLTKRSRRSPPPTAGSPGTE